mgnify:CR=1 FL=1
MKAVTLLLSILLLISCDTSTKEASWSEEQKENYVNNCLAGFGEVPKTEERNVEALCDCMLELLMRDYTPEEAENITMDEQREILTNCNYNW